MDNHSKHKCKKSRDENPSFSSTLLDQIYRSMDDPRDDQLIMYGEMKKKHDYITNTFDEPNFQQIENWMERKKKVMSKTAHDRYQKPAQFYSRNLVDDDDDCVNLNSSSNSNYRVAKPIKISANRKTSDQLIYESNIESSGVVKLKALKMYGDLKKVKQQQPISPGAKLAAFLNSIFSAKKKGKINSSNTTSPPASSTSRSCLSKTPSSKLSKPSVRFYPVTQIVDHKSLGGKNTEELKCESVEEVLVKNYQRKTESGMEEDEEEDDDDDDAASYASSDLFELDSLNNNINIMGDYMAELPLYETTYLDTNTAIANGLLV